MSDDRLEMPRTAAVSYWEELAEHIQTVKERLETWDGVRFKNAVSEGRLDPHTGNASDPYAFSDLHVLEDIDGVGRWIEEAHLKDALSFIMTYCRCYCVCVDDQPEEVSALLNEGGIKKCLDDVQIHVIRYDHQREFSINFDNIRQQVARVERLLQRSPQDILLFLLDANLRGDSAEGMVLGQTLFSEVTRHWPHAPVFTLTKYRDIPIVLQLGQLGADAFVYKPALALLPLQIARFHHQKLGRLVWGPQVFDKENPSPDPKTLSLLRDHILHWQRMPETLWFGDRVPILVEHCIEHCRNLWQLTESLFDASPRVFYEILGNDPTLYRAFLLSIWLHDIGHKGDGHYQDPPEVRALHGAISARLICRRPDLYLPHLSGDISEWSELIEYICAFCRYHMSNAPLDEEIFEKLHQEGRLAKVFELGEVPLLSDGSGQLTAPKHPLTLREEPVSGRRYVLLNERLRPAVSLFRLIDSLDMRANRVGESFYREVKLDAMRQEMVHLLERVRQAGHHIERELVRIYPHCRSEAESLHTTLPTLNEQLAGIVSNHKVICDRRSTVPSHIWGHDVIILGLTYLMEEARTRVKDTTNTIQGIGHGLLSELAAFRDWRTLVDYLILLSVQEAYMHLHLSFRHVRIVNEKDSLAVVYELARPAPEGEIPKALYLLYTSYFCHQALDYVKKEWRESSANIKAGIKERGLDLKLDKVVFDLGDNRRALFSLDGHEGREDVFNGICKQMGIGIPYRELIVHLEGLDPKCEFKARLDSEHESLKSAATVFLEARGKNIKEILVSIR